MRDRILASLLFAAVLAAALAAPVVQITDHKYGLMASASLAERGRLALDGLAIESGPLWSGSGARSPDYRIEIVNERPFHAFPIGGAVLDAPIVAVAMRLGVSPIDGNGVYDPVVERRLNRWIAAGLAATLATLLYGIARTLLAPGASVALTVLVVLGSQITSTLSRGLWSHGWAVVLLAAALAELLRGERGEARFRPTICATLLAWATICRPTLAIAALAVVLWMALRREHRRDALWMVAAGAAWALALVGWSLLEQGRWLPAYYASSRLSLAALPFGLAANLVSPSRSLLVFLPWVPWLAWAAFRLRHGLVLPGLVKLAAAVSAVHLLVISAFPHWYGGHCYGARLTTDIVPWLFVILAIVAEALLREPAPRARRLAVPGATLFAVAIALNGVGALSQQSWIWNAEPVSIDERPERLFSLPDAQFLAPFGPERIGMSSEAPP